MAILCAGTLAVEADLVVFDKDGVLLDFHRLWGPITVARAQACCAAAGRPELAEALRDLLGLSAAGRVDPRGMLAVASQNESRLAAATFLHQHGLSWHLARAAASAGFETAEREVDRVQFTAALPGIVELVGQLRAAGVLVAIATTDQTDGAEHFLRAAGLEGAFVSVVGVDRVAKSKPAPDMAALCCAEAGVAPARTVMVGDVDLDLLMGRAAGVVAVVGVLSGVGDAEMLGPLADVLLGSAPELLVG